MNKLIKDMTRGEHEANPHKIRNNSDWRQNNPISEVGGYSNERSPEEIRQIEARLKRNRERNRTNVHNTLENGNEARGWFSKIFG